MIPHDYPAISRSSILEVCEVLGLEGSDVASISIMPDLVTVTGRPGTQPLRLRVHEDV
jgi:hypothetical protein